MIDAYIDAVTQQLDVDNDGQIQIATDVVYIARVLAGLPAVPSSFRVLDSIPLDEHMAARIAALCS